MRFGVFLIFLFASCSNFPKDPKKTSERILNDTLRVGYSFNSPWVQQNDHNVPGGIEPEIIQNFAKKIPTPIKWVHGNEEQLVKMMEAEKIDIIISGFTDKSPWKNKLSFTSPYLKINGEKHVIAIAQGENKFLMQLEKHLRENKPAFNQIKK